MVLYIICTVMWVYQVKVPGGTLNTSVHVLGTLFKKGTAELRFLVFDLFTNDSVLRLMSLHFRLFELPLLLLLRELLFIF